LKEHTYIVWHWYTVNLWCQQIWCLKTAKIFQINNYNCVCVTVTDRNLESNSETEAEVEAKAEMKTAAAEEKVLW